MCLASSALRLMSNVSLMWKCRDTPSTPSTLPDPVLSAVIFQVSFGASGHRNLMPRLNLEYGLTILIDPQE